MRKFPENTKIETCAVCFARARISVPHGGTAPEQVREEFNMSHKYFAEDMMEACAILEALEAAGNYSGEVVPHNLLVSWRGDEELDWTNIYESAEEKREELGVYEW